MQPRAAQANEKFAVFDPGMDIAQVEPKQAQEAYEVRLHKRNPLQKTELVLTHVDVGQALDLMPDFAQIRT